MDCLLRARLYVGLLTVFAGSFGVLLLLPCASRVLTALPRLRITGIVLSAVCWIWVGAELYLHPIDFLSFLTPERIIFLTILCIPLTWLLLPNLLCTRAIGGLLMLCPMPLIHAVRDQVTDWRVVPVLVGYFCLVVGMFAVFYPWTFRMACGFLAKHRLLRTIFAGGWIVVTILLCFTFCSLGKAVGA